MPDSNNLNSLHVNGNPYADKVTTLFTNIAHRAPTQNEIDEYSLSLATNGGDYSKVTNAIISSDAVTKVVNPILNLFQLLTGGLPTKAQIDAEVTKIGGQTDPSTVQHIIINDILSGPNNPFGNSSGAALVAQIASTLKSHYLGSVSSEFDYWAPGWGGSFISQGPERVINGMIEVLPAFSQSNQTDKLIDFYNHAAATGNAAQSGSLTQYTPVVASGSSGPISHIYTITIGSDGTFTFADPAHIYITAVNGQTFTGSFTNISGFQTGLDKIVFSVSPTTISSSNGNSYVALGGATNFDPATGDLYMAKGSYSGTTFTTAYDSGGSTILYYDADGANKAVVLTGVTNFHPTTDLINS